MNLSRLFIERPVATILLAIGITLSGILAYRLLPVSPLPQVDYPSINVSARLPGASPESMAANVTAPLERALGSIAGLREIRSNSAQGQANIDLRFDIGRNLDDAARDVQAAINLAAAQLPSGMPSLPTYRKINPSQAPILALALSSPQYAPGQLFDLASTILAQKLAQIPGVGAVEVGGSSLPAVRVSLDPNALNQYGIALDEVATAIRAANAQHPLGAVEAGTRHWQIEANLQLRDAADYRELIVTVRDGRPVHLGDVAQVNQGVEDRYASGFHNDRDAVLLVVSRQPNANIIQTVDAIHAQMPALRALLPAGVDMAVAMDRSPVIRATLAEAQFTLLLAVALVVLVVLAFLGNLRAALMPTLAIPVVLAGTLGVIWLCGFSLNNLSLMALIVAAILIVDDAIVVLENISRHIEQGASPMQAALRGAGEVGVTLLSMNIALSVVFISILFLDDFIERLFREFSITLVAAMLVSLAVSLSLTPTLCARLLRARRDSARDNALQRGSRRFFQRSTTVYARSLESGLRHVPMLLTLFVCLIGFNVWLFTLVPKGMMPTQDTGQLRGFARGDDGLSFQVMQPKLDRYRELLLADPAIEDIIGYIGGGSGINNAFIMIKVKPLAERGVSSQQVIDRLREQMPKIPGGMLWLWVDQDIRIEGGGSEGNYQYLLLSDDLPALRRELMAAGNPLSGQFWESAEALLESIVAGQATYGDVRSWLEASGSEPAVTIGWFVWPEDEDKGPVAHEMHARLVAHLEEAVETGTVDPDRLLARDDTALQGYRQLQESWLYQPLPDGRVPAHAVENEETDGWSAEWAEAEAEARDILSELLTEVGERPLPEDELRAVCAKLRRNLAGGGRRYDMAAAAGGVDPTALPADDIELWLTLASGVVECQDEVPFGGEADEGDDGMGDMSEQAAWFSIGLGDWMGAVVTLAQAGPGTYIDAETLAEWAIKFDPESGEPDDDPEFDPFDEFDTAWDGATGVLEVGFGVVTLLWEVLGVLDRDGRLTRLGWWGAPEALLKAWAPREATG